MEGQENRYKDRKSRDFRQDKRLIILRHRAGPSGQRIRRRPAMMTGVAIFPAMEMEGPYAWLFCRICAGHADIAGHEVNADEQARHDAQQASSPTGPSTALHEAECVIHESPYSIKFRQL